MSSWPQIVMAAGMTANLILHHINHSRTTRYDFYRCCVDTFISACILAAGGFW